MARPYTGYIEEKQRRLTGAINELTSGPENDANMRYALQAVKAYAQLIIDDANMKLEDVEQRIAVKDAADSIILMNEADVRRDR